VLARALIVVADLLGLTEAHTSGGFQAMEAGLATSARLVVAGPWAPEVVRRYRGQDLGVSLTLTSPHPLLRLAPLTSAPTLRSGDGGLPRTAADLVEHADPDEARLELRMQLERAILWGIGVSHLAVLDESVLLRADIFDAVADLAEEYRLPLRLAPSADEERLGYNAWREACERGLITLAGIVPVDPTLHTDGRRLLEHLASIAHALPQGTSELALAVATTTPELAAWEASGGARSFSASLCAIAERLWQTMSVRGVERRSYRELSRRADRSRSDEPARAPGSGTPPRT